MSRRDTPDLIISDNAPQFKLVSTVLDKQWRKIFKDKDALYTMCLWKVLSGVSPLPLLHGRKDFMKDLLEWLNDL